MAKTVKTRIQHKRETATNWASATSFKPMDGELIVYKPDIPGSPAMLKVGDGSTVAKDLPFIKAGSATTADSATKATKDGAGNTITSMYAKNADLIAHTNNKSNPHGVTAAQIGALPTTGGTLTGILYTTAATPFLIGKNGKVGLRAATDDNNNVGQINISNSWYTDGDQWGAQMSALNGKTGKRNGLRVSHNGLEYEDEDEVVHKVLHDGNISSYAVPTTRKVNNKALSADISLTASDVGAATTTDITNAINNLDVNAPTASGNTTSFIDSVSQTNGKISATKKTITSASTSAAGIVKLNDAVNSTSTTTAATANAVKKAYDAATSAAADAASRAPAAHGHDYIQGGTVGMKTSDSNEVSFSSNANYIYFGYDNRMNSTGIVDTYKFGKHAGAASAADGNIECGSLVAGRTLKGGTVTVANAATLQYDSTNECLNFVFG